MPLNYNQRIDRNLRVFRRWHAGTPVRRLAGDYHVARSTIARWVLDGRMTTALRMARMAERLK